MSIRLSLVLVAAALAACDEEKKVVPTVDAAPAVVAPARDAAPAIAPPAIVDAGSDSAPEARFNPKHKCPTGQTHFYMEGDFCRRRCLTTSDCAGKERCSAMEYPFVFEGKTAGTAKFCEGM